MVPNKPVPPTGQKKASWATTEYSQLNQSPEIEAVDQGLDPPPVFHPISFFFVLCSLLPLYHRRPSLGSCRFAFPSCSLPDSFPPSLPPLSLPFFIPIALLGISLSYSLFCSLPTTYSSQPSSLSFSQSAFLSSSLPHLLYSPPVFLHSLSSFLIPAFHSVFSSIFLPTFLYLHALLPHLMSPSETVCDYYWDWLFNQYLK